MDRSENYNFYLPSRDIDDIVDVDQLSDNFQTIDSEIKRADQTFNPSSANPQSGTAVDQAVESIKTEITEIVNVAQSTAETAQSEAELAKAIANSAHVTAVYAANKAIEVAEQVSDIVPRYGVRFDGSANSGDTVHRLYNAVGLVANVGTDTQTAENDFDHIYPWSARRRCCGYWNEDGNFVVNAYKGEPGYSEDGTNGEVWIEHSLFYYKHTYDEGGAEEIAISATPIVGFLPAPIFVGDDGTVYLKAYTAAYPMATVDGKATSRSGVFPDTYSQISGISTARTLGDRYTITQMAEWYTECLYMWVEFATRNLQSVMMGATTLSYVATDTATIAENAVNRIVVTNTVAGKYVIGQTICIGKAIGNPEIAKNRVITSIDEYDANNKAIYFDGDSVNIAVGNIVFSTPWKNGSCDNVLSSSGSHVSNTSGKYNCVYRGKERPYGNGFEWISDVLIKRDGSGTTEDPYTCEPYFLPDATKYNNGTLTEDYIKLNFKIPANVGYVKTLGLDDRFPWVRLPFNIGAASTTWYSDYYDSPRESLCAPKVGGRWLVNFLAGITNFDCESAPSSFSLYHRARLSYHR